MVIIRNRQISKPKVEVKKKFPKNVRKLKKTAASKDGLVLLSLS